jgi:hypothetical protein
MIEHDSSPTGIDATPMADDQPDGEAAAIVELMDQMDQAAAQLQSQMQVANRHIRRRAARLLDPARTRTGAERRA